MPVSINPSNAPGFLIRRLQQISIRIFQDATAEAGISTVQYGALQVIERDPDIDQVRLSQGIDTDRTTITRIVERLYKLGLITRKSNPKDRRSNSLRVTRKGVDLLRQIEIAADASQAKLMSPLSGSDQVEFMRMLRTLVFAHSDPRFMTDVAAKPDVEDELVATEADGRAIKKRRAR